MSKKCSKCGETKNSGDFHPDSSRSDGITGYCKLCHNTLCRSYRKRTYNSEKEIKRFKTYRDQNPDKYLSGILKTRYGITLDDYNKMLLKQNSVCGICKQPEHVIDKRRNKLRALSVDHCHTTQKIRGLLCMACNIILGKTKDNVVILQEAIKYLEGHKNG